MTTNNDVVRHDIRTDWLRIDGGTQPRVELNLATVDDYSQEMLRGVAFTPVEAVYDGSYYWLWDGFHRWHAANKAGVETIATNIRNGTQEDAVWLSLGANASHGLRRTNEDKRRAVEGALRMRPGMSNEAIADHCGVSSPTVAKVREELTTLKVLESTTQRAGKDGRTTNTSNIGKGKGKSKPTPEDVARHEQEQHQAGEEMIARVQSGEMPTEATADLSKLDSAEESATDSDESEPPAKPKVPTDEGDVTIPERPAEAFAQVKDIRKFSQMINDAIKEAERLAKLPCGACFGLDGVVAHLNSAKNTIWQARPAHVCPYCGGLAPKCTGCKGRGWVTVSTYKAAPKKDGGK